MAKATHYGTCQVCGAVQKLPGGYLANHGYTVDYGYFNGVCSGSNHLPHEKSCNMVKKSIENAYRAIEVRKEQIENVLNTPMDKVFVTVRQTVGAKRVRLDLLLDIDEIRYSRIYYVYNDKRKYVDTHDYTNPVAKNHEDHANEIRKEIFGIEGYIESQKERVANWIERDLIPVESEVKNADIDKIINDLICAAASARNQSKRMYGPEVKVEYNGHTISCASTYRNWRETNTIKVDGKRVARAKIAEVVV